jgi:hypothetical protein
MFGFILKIPRSAMILRSRQGRYAAMIAHDRTVAI